MWITFLLLSLFTTFLHGQHTAFATSLLPSGKLSKLVLTPIHLLKFRGGSAADESTGSKSAFGSESAASNRVGSPLSQSRHHCADLIPSVCREFPTENDDEHTVLRQLVSSRFNTYVTDLKESIKISPGESVNAQSVPHPRKLLHYLAPKVPAIKQSPDVNLRVYSSRSGIDSCVAACIIGVMGHACEHYDKAQSQLLNSASMERPNPSYKDIVADRRFEQLVECIISSVNVEKRIREAESSPADLPTASEDDSEKCNLSVRDACRAAWGIAILGGHHLESLGGEKIVDVLQALSMHIRERLVARAESLVGKKYIGSRRQEELAQDAALSAWTFACVRACTGLSSDELLENCSSILNRDLEQISLQPLEGNSTNETDVATFASGENLNRTDFSFLTLLSPMEVTDLVWALAIHGSSNTTVELSSTSLPSTAVRKLQRDAFSRLFSWLSSDLSLAQLGQLETATVTDLDSPSAKETTTLKVVDAAALLASQANGDSSGESAPIQNLELENMTVSMSVSQGIPTQNNVSMAETSDNENLDQASQVSKQVRDVLIQGDDKATGEGAIVFHPPDMACIAWAVTELRDSSRMKIVPVVVEIVAMMGERGTQGLSGADLSNLAWALSRYEAELSNTRANKPSSLSLSLISWIAHSASEQVYTDDIDVFQPPELGRLVWALGCMLSVYSQVPDAARCNKDILELSTLALKKASANINIFDTENLLRICWAFLELHGEDRDAYDSSVAYSLGRILSTVERSLNEWERGDCAYPKLAGKATTQGTYTALFSSFFGRSKSNQPLLEQTFEERDEDGDNAVGTTTRSRLPLLRDLPVDPSTLCKAACAFQRLLIKHPEIKGGLKLTDVAVRLLSSKSARLMRECSIHDIVRILEAAVHSDAEGYGRQLSTGRFVYRIVQVLNEALGDNSGNDSVSRNIRLEAASPSEIALLFWALGCLGVKHTRDDEIPDTAYKRLRLVSGRNLLSSQQIQSMSTNDSLKLLKGMILMKLSFSNPTLLLDVLDSVHGMVPNLSSTTMLCELAEVVSIQLTELNSDNGSKQEIVKRSLPPTSDGDDDTEGVEAVAVSQETQIREICGEILTSVSHEAIRMVDELSPLEMRRLLSVFSLLPFQADEFVNVLEEKVTKAADEVGMPSVSTETLLRDARDKCDILRQKLSDDSSISRLEALKARLLSLFQTAEDTEPTPESNLPTDLADMIENAINASLEAFSNLENAKKKYGLDIDVYNQRTNEGSQFELGRCRELIANYRRVEFGTGFRRSRYDEERRQYILKQVLSRMR